MVAVVFLFCVPVRRATMTNIDEVTSKKKHLLVMRLPSVSAMVFCVSPSVCAPPPIKYNRGPVVVFVVVVLFVGVVVVCQKMSRSVFFFFCLFRGNPFLPLFFPLALL